MAVDTLSLDFGRDKPFYVYLYRDPRPRKKTCPIYVGKGTAANHRADVHWLAKTSSDRNPLFRAILIKIRAAGLAPIIEIIAWFDQEIDAFALECRLIAKFGRRDLGLGPLANLTDGGQGESGWHPSDATRALWSRQRKGRKPHNIGKPHSEATRRKIALKATGRIATPAMLAGHRAVADSRRGKPGKLHTNAARAAMRAGWQRRRERLALDQE